jgi:hypothetical protein
MIRRLLLTAIAPIAIASPIAAQQWRVDVQGGRIRSALDPSARGTESVAAGIGYEDPAIAFRISTGIPTRTDAPYWGALGAWKRLALRKSGFISGIDLSGNGFVFQDRTERASQGGGILDPLPQPAAGGSGHALAGMALPLIGFETGSFQLQARAGISYYTATIGGQDRERTVRLGDIQLTFQPTPSFALAPIMRRFQATSEMASTFAGLSGVVAQGRASFWGNAGQWLDGTDATSSTRTAWGLGGSLRLTERATLNASARHDGFDPLYLNPPQTSWGVGLSILVGARPHSPAAPVPAAYHNGLATIRLPVSSVAAVPSVAGDFNNWIPARMKHDGKFWSYTVAAAPGVYNYAFVSANGDWFVPENVPGRKDDGMGGQVAVLVVR